LAAQIRAQEALAEHAAADERRPIACEIHDVIASRVLTTYRKAAGGRPGKTRQRDVTVKSHIGRIFTKLDLRDRAAAIVYAYDTGIVARR
jgi:hypothetical protein